MLKVILKTVLKIVVLPVILVLTLTGVMLNAGIKLYCIVSAFVFKVLGLCVLIAVCTSQWQSLLIIGIMIAVVLFIAFGASFIMAQIEICRDGLRGYLRA